MANDLSVASATEKGAYSPIESLQKLGSFQIVRRLGEGGFAPVFLAHEVYGGVVLRDVALKVFLVPTINLERRRAIVAEARALCRVEHPNVVRFLQLTESEDGEFLGLAMELVQGVAVADRMEQTENRLPEEEAIDVAIATASALVAVHRAGLVHRDVKPANVVATGGTYKLIDFGIAVGRTPAAGSQPPASGPHPPSGSFGASGGPAPSSVRILAAPNMSDEDANERTVMALPTAPTAPGTPVAPGRGLTAPLVRMGGTAVMPQGARPARQGTLPSPSHAAPTPPPAAAAAAPGTAPLGEVAPSGLTTTDLTGNPETLAGTLGFIDPECMGSGMLPNAVSDLYALGAMMYEMLAGRLPAERDRNRLDQLVLTGVMPPPPLREVAPHVSQELAALVDALVTPVRAQRPQSAEIVVSELERVRRLRAGQDVPLPSEEEGPFRGLDRFEARHRAVYFGRSAEVAAALDLLRNRGLLVIAGASGSGKSSLARAAVVPSVETGGLGQWPRQWDSIVVAPSQAADLRGWLSGMAGLTLPHGADADAALAALGRRAEATGRGLVVLIDQMEELFTTTRVDTSGILDLLARSAERPVPGIRFVTTVRRDFFDPLLADARLSRVLGRSVLVVHPLSTAAWLETLDQSLARYGYGFESPEMRDTLAGQLKDMSDAMPLVQFALAKLWAQRDRQRRVLTMAALMGAGGLAGALDQHAEGVVARLVQKHGPAAVEAVRVVTATLTTAQGTRATRTREAILERAQHPLAQAALDALVEGRLVTVESGAATLTHDVLVTAWERLRRWTQQARQERELAEELERQAAAWSKRPAPELLWRGIQLEEARALVARRSVPLGKESLAFVAASRRLALRGRAGGVALVGLLGLAGLLAYGLYTDTIARQEKSEKNVSTLLDRAATRADRSAELSQRLQATQKALAACRKAGSGGPTDGPSGAAPPSTGAGQGSGAAPAP